MDPRTGEVLHDVFRVYVKDMKRGYAPVPRQFVEGMGVTRDVEPLNVLDLRRDDRLICKLHSKAGLLEGLGEWVRTRAPGADDIILLVISNPQNRECIIELESETTSDGPEGLYLGNAFNMVGGQRYEAKNPFRLPLTDLPRHAYICGTTGSGKTVLAKAIIEEAVLHGIPVIAIDLKGDLSSVVLAITSAGELQPWTYAAEPGDVEAKAEKDFKHHLRRLDEFGLGLSDIQNLRQRVRFRVFTPASRRGIPIGFGAPLRAPSRRLQQADSEDVRSLLDSVVGALIERLYPGVRSTKVRNERNFVYEIVKHCWSTGIPLDGKEGLQTLMKLIQEPPFGFIGDMPVADYIDDKNRRRELLIKVNTLISGPEEMWFEGDQMSMELFLPQRSDEGVPLNIVNLSNLDRFEDRSFVVAQIAYEISRWMSDTRGGGERPRLLFFIDEIGQGGGKEALYPSYPYECAAKWGLNYLVKQGRAFGVCCVFASQNPGDVDYKALSNCHTWMIGQLSTDRDRGKALEGVELAGMKLRQVTRYLATADTGQFVVKTARGEVVFLKERWLLTQHLTIPFSQLRQIRHGIAPERPPRRIAERAVSEDEFKRMSPQSQEVWRRILETEIKLRKLIGMLYKKTWGKRADKMIEKLLGPDQAPKVLELMHQAPERYKLSTDHEPSQEILDYTFLGQLVGLVVARDAWRVFQPVFGDKQDFERLMAGIKPVRDDLAHGREVPQTELERAKVNCNDVVALIREYHERDSASQEKPDAPPSDEP